MHNTCSIALLVFALIGCASHAPHSSAPPTPQGIQVQILPTDQAELPPPAIQRSDDVLVITGTVRQKSIATTAPAFAPHIEITFVGKDGVEQDMIPLALHPSPTARGDGTRESTYELRYGFIPPAGTIVRIEYAADYDVGGSDYGSSAPGSNPGGYYTRTPGTPAHKTTPPTRGTPRSNNSSGGRGRR